MTVFIRDLLTWDAVGEYNATSWSVPAEAYENKNGQIIVAGKIDCSGQWAIIDGKLFYIEKSSEDNGLTTLSVIKPLYAFRRSLVFTGNSYVELGNFIAGKITSEFINQSDANYQMPYIEVSESVTVNADLGLRNNEVYSFTDVFDLAEQNGVGFDFTADYDSLAIRIYQRTYSQFSLFPGDGHTFLVSSNITKETVSKATVRRITVINDEITVSATENYYWHEDGTISTTPPVPPIKGSWVTVSVDKDEITLAAAAAEAMRGNVATYKFVFRAEEDMSLGDRISILINGEAYNGVITLVNLSSDGRTYEAGSLPVTLTEKINASGDVRINSVIYETRNDTGAETSNRNLIDNPWFQINQRQLPSYSGGGYTLDRWQAQSADSSVSINANGSVRFGAASDAYVQLVERKTFEALVGKSLTISVLYDDGEISSGTVVVNWDVTATSSYIAKVFSDSKITMWIAAFPPAGSFQLARFMPKSGISFVDIRAIKAEIGNVSTLALDFIPDYSTELAKCQRYFNALGLGSRFACGVMYTSTEIAAAISFPPMRTNPVLSYADIKILTRNGYINITNPSLYLQSYNAAGINGNIPASGLNAGEAFLVEGTLHLSAEL